MSEEEYLGKPKVKRENEKKIKIKRTVEEFEALEQTAKQTLTTAQILV